MGSPLKLENQVYGKLTVIRKSQNKNEQCYWYCRCECGDHKDIAAQRLRNGQTRSCGCLSKHHRKRKPIGSCARCHNDSRQGKTTCQACADRIALVTSQRRTVRLSQNLCPACGNRSYNTTLCSNCNDKMNAHLRVKRQININYRLKCNLRTRLGNALKGNYKSGSAVSDLGCSVSELKHHLESKFQIGMSWDNHGRWHIDHIDPLASFDLTDREQFLQACHYTNLQPLWAKDNLSKSNK